LNLDLIFNCLPFLQGSLATNSGEDRRVILKRVKDRVQGAKEMAEMEHLLNVYASTACRKSVAPFLGYLTVDPSEVRGKLTKGLWLVWEAQGLNTLAYYLRRRDCIPALAKDLSVAEEAVLPTVMNQIFECLIDLHNAGLVHRDIKPANIVFSDAERRFKLIDLGAAADLRTGTNYSPDKTILDPMYCPPEEYVLPSDAPDLSENNKLISSLAMSPLLWQQHRPDCFDTWSAGIILLQLGLPFLRTTSALRNWKNTFARCNYDIEEWRMRASLSAKQTALLDANDSLGWDLVAGLLRPREVESDDNRGVRFINTGAAPRLTPSAALKYPFFKTAAAVGSRSSGTTSNFNFGSLFSLSSSQDEDDTEEEEEIAVVAYANRKNNNRRTGSGSSSSSRSRGSTSRGTGGSSKSKSSSSKSRGALILDSSTVIGGVGASTRNRSASTWNWMKSKLFDLEARVAQEASETQTQTTIVQELRKDVAAGKASKADLEKEESALLSMRSSLQTSAKELNTLFSSARGFLSAVVKRGGSAEINKQLQEEKEILVVNPPPQESLSSSQVNDSTTDTSTGVSKSVTDAATNAIYSSLKFTGMALNAVSDLAAAAERGVSKAQAEAEQRRAANTAFIDALQAVKPPLSATSTWEEVSAALPENEKYAVLTTTQQRQAFEIYIDALQRAQRSAAQRAAIAFTTLLEEIITTSATSRSDDINSTMSYEDFATGATASDPRFTGVESDADRRAAFDAFIAKRRAEEQRILAEIAEEAERAAARAASAKAAEEAAAAAAASSASTAPNVQQLEFLKAEQARLKDEYSRMEAKLQEMEKALSVQNLVGSLLDDGSVVETDEEGNVIFRFAAAAPPAGVAGKQQHQKSTGGIAEPTVETAASRDYY